MAGGMRYTGAMDNKICGLYGTVAGKNARCVAAWAANGEWERAAKRAPNARADLELMHPRLWRLWSGASMEAFGAIVSLMDPREAAVLSGCVDEAGRGVVDFFAEQPGKLRALSKVGVDLDRPGSTELWGSRVDPGVSQAGRASVAGLAGLAAAGLAAPGPFSTQVGDGLGKRVSGDQRMFSVRTALHLLAASPRWSDVAKASPGLALGAMGWLATGADPAMRNQEGRDALSIAVDAGCAATAKLLLSMGLDPTRKDAKGRDVMEALARRAKALRVAGEPYGAEKARELDELLPELLVAAERRELDMEAPWAQGASAPRRKSL